MKKEKKVAIIVAGGLIMVGLIIGFIALAATGFKFENISTTDYEKNTYTIDEEFNSISVEGQECDIYLYVADDEKCEVVCYESDEISHNVTVKNGKLTIKRVDNRKWYDYIHIGFFEEDMKIAVYLPESEYESLYAKSSSGDIEIPKAITFGETDIESTSGDVSFRPQVKNDLSVKTTSGDIEVSGVQCGNVTAQSTSGDIFFGESTALEEMYIKSTSGDVEMNKCDAASLEIKTTSGEVTGTLLTEKVFITDTKSGDIDVPHTTTGGICEIKTTSGDIEIDVID